MLAEYVSPAGRRAMAGEEGLTLVEIMIAAFLLAVAILGLASVATTSLASVRDSRERDRATAAASSAIEAVRALEYNQIALTGTDWQTDPLVQADGTLWRLDHDGDGDHTEVIWATSSGVISPYACTSETDGCWFEMPAGTGVQVRTFVTWYERDGDPEAAKRVTTVATWLGAPTDGRRTVRLSTVVADTDRGLPAPDFEIVPDALFTSLDEIWVEELIEEGEAHCFAHRITNFGTPDHYEIAFAPTPAESTDHGWLPAPDVHISGEWRNEFWIVRAYFVMEGQSRGDPGTLMLPDPAAVGDNPVSSTALATDPPDNGADLHFCYQPRSSADGGTSPASEAAPFVYVYPPTVHSRFDLNVSATVEHTITVGALDTLHLQYGAFECDGAVCDWFEHIHDGSYTRPAIGRTDGVFSFASLPMTRSGPPAGTSMPSYDAVIRHDGTNFNHNTDALVGRLGRPGMFLPFVDDLVVAGTAHPRSAFAVEWDWQFDDETAPVSYTGSARIVNMQAIRHPDGTAPPPQQRWCIDTELLKFEMAPDGTLPATPTKVGGALTIFTPGGGGWRPLNNPEYVVPWDTAEVSFKPGDVLRLRIVNAGPQTGVDCARLHIGFGAADFPAAVLFEVAE